MVEALRLETDDGIGLEGELARATVARAAMALCHPHPQFGGSMRSLVISALFDALPAAGVTCLRFNFRGVEASEGAYDEGDLERADAEAAVRRLAGELTHEQPLVLAGWSFGADVALSVRDERVSAWLAIAPPLRFARDLPGLAADPRPKLLGLAQHDEFRDPAEVTGIAESWASTDVHVVGGASHFFMGRTDRLVELATAYVDRLTGDAG
jgi:uncharacterized protein